MSRRSLSSSGIFLTLSTALVLLATLGGLLHGCKSGTGPDNSGASIVSVKSGAHDMGAQAFAPNPETVSIGSAVTWRNDDTVNHTITSNTGLFNSGTLAPGGSFSFTFTTAGSYAYHCTVSGHNMTGTVVVQQPSY